MQNLHKTPPSGRFLSRENFAAVVTGEDDCLLLSELDDLVGWAEFRIDEILKVHSESEMISLLSTGYRQMKIGTVRWHRESMGSGPELDEDRRMDLYRRILDYVDYIDVEIESGISETLSADATRKAKKVILSYHNFSQACSPQQLESIYSRAEKLRPDAVKFATTVGSTEELYDILSFTYKHAREIPLIVTPMGVSIIERLMPLYLGSLFTYVSLSSRTAPGQPSAEDIERLRDIMSG